MAIWCDAANAAADDGADHNGAIHKAWEAVSEAGYHKPQGLKKWAKRANGNGKDPEIEALVKHLGESAGASDYIHDFVHSSNSRFKDKSKKERIRMALGAYYGKVENEPDAHHSNGGGGIVININKDDPTTSAVHVDSPMGVIAPRAQAPFPGQNPAATGAPEKPKKKTKPFDAWGGDSVESDVGDQIRHLGRQYDYQQYANVSNQMHKALASFHDGVGDDEASAVHKAAAEAFEKAATDSSELSIDAAEEATFAAFVSSAQCAELRKDRGNIPKDLAGYMDKSNYNDYCARCINFEPPDGCDVLIGEVSPQGWCKYFHAEAAEEDIASKALELAKAANQTHEDAWLDFTDEARTILEKKWGEEAWEAARAVNKGKHAARQADNHDALAVHHMDATGRKYLSDNAKDMHKFASSMHDMTARQWRMSAGHYRAGRHDAGEAAENTAKGFASRAYAASTQALLAKAEIAKSEELPEGAEAFTLNAEISKVDDSLGLVMGHAIICTKDGQPYYDLQGDFIPEDAMLKAATDFMLNSRIAGNMHARDDYGKPVQDGTVVFMWPLTTDIAKAMDVDNKGNTGLWIGMKPSPDVLDKFKSGEMRGFSIGGYRVKDEVPE
jgi:hypothetical protein